MTTLFPGSQDDFANPLGTDGLAAFGHAALHSNVNDAIEAIEAKIGTPDVSDPTCLIERIAATEGIANAALPATQVAAGGLITAATDKTTPVDADLVGLSDSESAGVLKKWSWANIKTSVTTALTGVFAKLSGVAGGQTLIGGTQAADVLTLQGTSATGTGTAVKVLCGTAGATEALTVLESGYVGIGNAAPGYPLEVGTKLRQLASGVLCVGTPTSETVVLTPGTFFAVNSVIQSTSGDDNANNRSLIVASHNITPTANVTKTRYALIADCKTDSATAYTYSQIRTLYANTEHTGSGTLTNAYASYSSCALRAAGAIGTGRAAFMSCVQHATSTGNMTTARSAEYSIERKSGATGTITTGACIDAWIGNYSSSGKITTAIGVGIGDSTDPWYNSGTIDNAYAIHIGSSTNIGTNKKAIYSLSAAQSYFAGGLAIGLDAASAKLHSVATTEQLRLGYDAAKYASFTVDSAGLLKIAAPLIITPPASITPATNGDLVIEATSNTSVTFKLKGSDGTVRSGSLTLS